MRLVCPAATPIWAGIDDGDSVICGVLALSNDGASNRGFQSRGQVSALISGEHDTATVRFFCCGDGSEGTPACYTRCELWRAQREADWAARTGPDALRDVAHREYVDQDHIGELLGA